MHAADVAFTVERLRRLRGAVGERPGSAELAQVLSHAIAPGVGHDALRLLASYPGLGVDVGVFSLWHQYDADAGRALLSSHYRARRRQRALDRPRRGWRVLDVESTGRELQVALDDTHGSWGTLGLLRAGGRSDFGLADVQRLRELRPALAALVREMVTARPLVPATPPLPAGVVIVDAAYRTRSVSPEARAWLRLGQQAGNHGTPEWAEDAANTGMSLVVRRRLRDPDAPAARLFSPPAGLGRWLTVHGQPLGGETDDVAIVFEAAGGQLLLPVFCQWYGITAREQQVVAQLLTGAAPKQVARRLELSPHTLNAHLKAVYRKTGAQGRDELTAALNG